MNIEATPGEVKKTIAIKVFGVGDAGIKALEQMAGTALAGVSYAVLNSKPEALAASSITEKLQVEAAALRSLSSRHDREKRLLATEDLLGKFKPMCAGVDVVLIVAGLGGATGTRLSPILARAAQASGALVLSFVTLPFEFEGTRRCHLAEEGMEELKEIADGVICLPNQKILKLVDENTSVLETFKLTNELLVEGVRGIWRLLSMPGLIEIDFADFCATVRGRHAESLFAAAESAGPTRSREVVDKLLSHPMLDGGKMLAESETVLVSLMSGPDLTMVEVNRVMEEINRRCEHAQVVMGAALDENFRERLAVTLIAARKDPDRAQRLSRERQADEELETQLLSRAPAPRPGSRFVPPPPALPPEKMEQLLNRQNGGSRPRRGGGSKLKQTQLPLEIVSKGRFDKSEPTIHKGEDLDVPTYIRRGVALN
jgi:cell division protein FtsZ